MLGWVTGAGRRRRQGLELGLGTRTRLLGCLLGRLLALIISLGALATAQGAAAQQMDALGGGYVGIDEAKGVRIILTPSATGFEGLFIDNAGGSVLFDAVGDAAAAEARIDFFGLPAYMRFSPRPVGMMAFYIPIDPATDALQVEEARPYAFLREGVELPETPPNMVAPPKTLGDYQEPVTFLWSYEFWQPQEVGRGYSNMSERYRTLLRLYAHVHTDVLWKLCQSRATPPGLAEALQGQNVTCPDVLQAVAKAQRSGSFARYKSDLAAQKAMLIDAVRCTRGGLMHEQCLTISKITAEAAISLATAATVLAKY